MNEDFIKALDKAGFNLTEFLDVYSSEIEELIETGHCDLTLRDSNKVWKLYLTIKKD
jgi:hypothetical protein